MIYLRVRWKHSAADVPVLLFSELDDARWEVRKVEVYKDGRMGFADPSEEHGGTRLGERPVPALAEIPPEEFEPVEIDPQEFERVWADRRGRYRF